MAAANFLIRLSEMSGITHSRYPFGEKCLKILLVKIVERAGGEVALSKCLEELANSMGDKKHTLG